MGEIPSELKIKGYAAEERILQAMEKEWRIRQGETDRTRGRVRRIVMEHHPITSACT
jgi:hypothetical protein